MSKKSKPMSKKDKSMPIKSWRDTDPKIAIKKIEPSYVIVMQTFDSLKPGWVVQYENDFWRIVSVHTNNILKIRKLNNPKSGILKIENLNTINVRFLMKPPRILKNSNIKKSQSVTMDFDKLYGKTWSISGGLPSLGKKR